MAIHEFKPHQYYNEIGTFEPALVLRPGDTVITKALDAHGIDENNKQVATRPNPLTGPFYIEGSRPGDTLGIHIDQISPNRSMGWSKTVIDKNLVEPSYVKHLPENFYCEWKIDTKKKQIIYLKPDLGHERISVPILPMLGCIGVCPQGGKPVSTETSHKHGGNMDYRGISEGVTIYLPVFVEGALLFLGDGHASQGDGEIAGSGIEVSFDIRFSVQVIEGKKIGWPRGENDEYIFTMGNSRPLEQALQHATTEMIGWLKADYDLYLPVSSILMNQYVEYDIGNVYDPAYTIVCKMPKSALVSESG